MELERQLKYNWQNPNGMDISNLLRGKIQMLEDILETKNIFNHFDNLKKTVEEEANKAKGAN